MKQFKRISAIVLALLLIFTAIPVNTLAAAKNPTIAKKATVQVKKSKKLSIKANGWTIQKVTSKSSAKKVATVKATKKAVTITGKKAGKANVITTIKAKKAKKTKTFKITTKVTVKAAPAPVVTEDQKKTAASQDEIDAALADGSVKELTIETQSAATIKLSGAHTDVALIVDAPNATIENEATWKSITIKAIAQNTWKEKAQGNVIETLNKAGIHIVLEDGASLKDLKVSTDATGKVTVEVTGGSISSMSIKSSAPVDLKLSGNAKVSEVKVEGKSDVNIDAKGTAEIGKVEVKASGADVDVNAAGNAKVGEVAVTKDAAGTATEKTKVDVKAEGSAEVAKVTTAAENSTTNVVSNGSSKVSDVKVEGTAQATIGGSSSNTTTLDVSGASGSNQVTVNTDTVKVQTDSNTNANSVINNQSGKNLPTTTTDSNGNTTSGTTSNDKQGGGTGTSDTGSGDNSSSSSDSSSSSSHRPKPSVTDTSTHVSTTSEFEAAWVNSSVTEITLDANIVYAADKDGGVVETGVNSGVSNTNSFVRSTSLKINMNGKVIDLGPSRIKFVRGNISTKRTYEFTGTGSVSSGGHWTIQVQGGTNADAGSAELKADSTVQIINSGKCHYDTPLDAFIDDPTFAASVDFSGVSASSLKKSTNVLTPGNGSLPCRIQVDNGKGAEASFASGTLTLGSASSVKLPSGLDVVFGTVADNWPVDGAKVALVKNGFTMMSGKCSVFGAYKNPNMSVTGPTTVAYGFDADALASKFTVSTANTAGKKTFTYATQAAPEDLLPGAPTAVGSYIAIVSVSGAGIYAPWSESCTFAVTKANAIAPQVTLATGLTYTGEAQSLISSALESNLGTANYAVTAGDVTDAPGDGWGTNVAAITKTDAGTYKVWAKVVGDENTNGVDAAAVGTVTIAKKALAASMVGITGEPTGTEPVTTTAVILTVTDGVVLSSGTDYEVAYAYVAATNEVDIYYTATITGKGNYTGSVTKYYYNNEWRIIQPTSSTWPPEGMPNP